MRAFRRSPRCSRTRHGSFLNRDSLGQQASPEGGRPLLAGGRERRRPRGEARGRRARPRAADLRQPAGTVEELPGAHAACRGRRRPRARRRRVIACVSCWARAATATGAGGTPEEMTMLDGYLEAGGRFVSSCLRGGRPGSMPSRANSPSGSRARTDAPAGHRDDRRGRTGDDVVMASSEPAHFVLMAATANRRSLRQGRAAGDVDRRRCPADACQLRQRQVRPNPGLIRPCRCRGQRDAARAARHVSPPRRLYR